MPSPSRVRRAEIRRLNRLRFSGAEYLKDPDRYHGACRICGHRRILYLPAKLCDKCVPKVAALAYAARFFGHSI